MCSIASGACSSEEEMCESIQRVADYVLDYDLVRACGGVHSLGALLIAQQYLTTGQRDRVDRLVSNFRNLLAERYADGYVHFPGLHDSSDSIEQEDRLRVLAHLLEALALVGGPYSQVEQEVMRHGYKIAEAILAQDEPTSRQLGYCCHAVSALRFLNRSGELK